ncbi:MAG: hypothetical protein HYX41_05660 [Bdellovibrio sp.]|nr:hypothetical protein [Bdellovibrio sp.]
MIRQFASLVAILSVLLGGVAGCGSQSGPANSTQAQTSGGGEEKTKMEEVDDPTLLPQFKGVLKFDSATADRPEVKHRADSYQRFFSAPLSLVLDFSSNLVKITFTGLPVSAAESCVADVV